MTSASSFSITCQACGLTSTVPVDALLVSVAVDDHRTTLPGADAETGVDHAGAVAWTCERCADLTTGRIGWTALLTLVTAGATLLDEAADDAQTALLPHPEQPADGAPLEYDDLLALHELLASDTWFDQVSTH